MKRVNEIFYSIQGEGFHTGTPAIFIRFSGCNLKCPFCDTDFKEYKEMSEEEILMHCKGFQSKFIVLTGGEPTLQTGTDFIRLLKLNGYYVAMETNGTHEVPEGIDWVTCSPKSDFCGKADVVLKFVDEVKVVYDKNRFDPEPFLKINARYYYLQPCDEKNEERNQENLERTIAYCLEYPTWRISLQTQKILKVR